MVCDREIEDMDRRLTFVGLGGSTSTAKEHFKDEKPLSPKRVRDRQKAFVYQGNDLVEEGRMNKLYVSRNADVCDQERELGLTQNPVSALAKGKTRTDKECQKLTSRYRQENGSLEKPGSNVNIERDSQIAFYQG